MTHPHFEQREALEHVVEKRVEGIISLSESHGLETPGAISAGTDAARETAVVLFFVWFLLWALQIPIDQISKTLLAFSFGWLIWKTGRSAWLGWARLERLHRIIEQEKYEIEHHRNQEREELRALYQAKGFEGKLLEDVLDVLMADPERLLHIMLEEELGLTLQAYEHPLKQCFGALLGLLIALATISICYVLLPHVGMPLAMFLILGVSAATSAFYEKNRVIAAIIWNCAIASLAVGVVFFINKLFR